ncbi:lysophospholipid acyltransferase family protein [Paenibacillus sp. GCM10028914]|uniref:lysophospholipid acyltransferase family protein n=1 Tax=Paenibacillus sp. GCM10028914 TaxID=3273416 RepID=UPI0036242590
MIEANKRKGFEYVFQRYNEHYLLRRYFHEITLRGELDWFEMERPVIYVMNHSSWWDGLLVYHVIRKTSSGDHYMMMDEKQMNKYRFFRKIGAFSIDKSSVKGIWKSLHYAEKLLSNQGRVWLFPQGEIYHQDIRPLRLQSGIGYLLAKCPNTAVVPVTMLTFLVQHQKPEASIWVGDPMLDAWDELERKNIVERVRVSLEKQLEKHRNLVIEEKITNVDPFVPILRAGYSTNDIFDAAQRRLKHWNSFFK